MTGTAPVLDLVRYDVPTAHGPAQVRIVAGADDVPPAGSLLLGHGAGGSRDAADVRALTALDTHGWTIVLVDQPWRVAGRKVATPPPTLDRSWLDVVAYLGIEDRAPDGTDLPRPWVYGGRSAGARVACRTSVTPEGSPRPGVAGVLCLAFPLHPPGRPERTRLEELAGPPAAGLPTLVVNGARDPMGTPPQIIAALGERPSPVIHAVPGTHSPTRDLDAVFRHAREFLTPLSPVAPHRAAVDRRPPR